MNIEQFTRIIPSSERNLKRLMYLLSDKKSLPRIAVFGKYNHGKSTLLNAIVGHNKFKTADKRETICNEDYEHNHVIWVDTPGLDADIHGEDDAAAMKGAFEVADFIFLVHQVTAGELDKYEMNVFQQLAKQDKNYRKKMFLILTQIDQKTPEDLSLVQTTIAQQLKNSIDLQDLNVISVSATRYLKGIQESKLIFCEKSGMNSIFSLIETLKKDITSLRANEINRLKSKLFVELDQAKKQVTEDLYEYQYRLSSQYKYYQQDIAHLVSAVSARR
ncbi:TPA: GTPase [Photobacterium damselae]|uniref:GTPase n=1 Tax=Photobacterium leiognathi TaxID=553611 RepID=UPI002980BA51|nr:GTPase [Photobacterium leiognathi]